MALIIDIASHKVVKRCASLRAAWIWIGQRNDACRYMVEYYQ